jgi:protein-serine/threonine kinase
MSAISSTPYVLPPRRPWDPSRNKSPSSLACAPHSNNALNGRLDSDSNAGDAWIEGSVVKGHPNICPLLDFFEDHHYYYLILPSTIPAHKQNEPPPPIDLFDVVEGYPQGLPPHLVRSYLGQIADALCFLHSLEIGRSETATGEYGH